MSVPRFACPHGVRVVESPRSKVPVALDVPYGGATTSFLFRSVDELRGRMRDALEDDDQHVALACGCLGAWALSENCAYCHDGEVVGMHRGWGACGECLSTFRESCPSAEMAVAEAAQ